ncbi:polysaccharide biosynthesis protein [Synergistales bacterium]|nr:polysaccharide biosynthesis protein [Synergistales bacterium]
MRERLFSLWLNIAKRNRRIFILDVCLLAFAVYISFALRLTLLIPARFTGDLAAGAALFPFCVSLLFYICGIYRVYWPQASVEEYSRLAKAYVCGGALFMCADFFMADKLVIPRTSLATMLLSGLFLLAGMRASWRLAELSRSSGRKGKASAKRAIIIGAGEAGAFVARDLQRRDAGLIPVGFIDDAPEKQNMSIAGIPVLGNDSVLEEVTRRVQAEVALIAIPSASGSRVREYLDGLSRSGVEVRVLPSLRELAGGTAEIGDFRSVRLEDLLRREPIKLDETGISDYIKGRRVLITGAGGSIGSEIVSQAARHFPSEIFALGHGEGSIYNLMQSIRRETSVPCHPIIADIADPGSMERFFGEHGIDAVFHAAAHKHVPLMEENPREALRVNALGTWTLSETAGRYGVKRFVMISTDKAVHPSSVMGASKRAAERLLMNVSASCPNTRYMAVRSGNVLGSRGSVVPLFERQIKEGGPVTVTHRDMTRYFMLIPEAVSLVLQAGAMGRGGELYVLDMGKPVNITEMAETLIRLHGKKPYGDVPITFTGIRPGEKLFEELFYDPAHVDTTIHDKIFLTKIGHDNKLDIDEVRKILSSGASDGAMRDMIFSLAMI